MTQYLCTWQVIFGKGIKVEKKREELHVDASKNLRQMNYCLRIARQRINISVYHVGNGETPITFQLTFLIFFCPEGPAVTAAAVPRRMQSEVRPIAVAKTHAVP